MKKICLITGVGPGTGSALVRRFAAGGYQVAMLARTLQRLEALAGEQNNVHPYACDVSDEAALAAAFAAIRSALGAPTVIIHNAVGAERGTYMDIDPAGLRRAFEINTMALLHIARLATPDMIEAGGGAIICTGNTSAYRGKPAFAGFAPSKAAQRILLESIAREAGPKGIHAAYLAIDAVIDLPWTREFFKDKPDEFFCQPNDIAAACYDLAHQPRSAWASEMVIRPFSENW